MIFTQIFSFFCVIIFIVVYNLSSLLINNKKVSNILLFIGSGIILTTITSWVSIGLLFVVSTAIFFWGKFLNRTKQKKLHLGIAIGVLIILFIIRSYEIANLDLLHRIGLSYILFRLIHYLIESKKNTIKEYNLIGFINYILFFPNFIAGPIDEYNNFNYWIRQSRNSYKWLMIKAGLFRLSLGIIKKYFLVPIIINYSLNFSLFEAQYNWQEGLLFSSFLYSFYILLDFSGYTDIAVGTSYLIGIKTPENFDNPYFANNLSKFWKKWHMTFSNFLFKYVFKPLVTGLSKRYQKSPRLFISSIGYIFTFIICGIWHGNTLNFLYWGLWHGIGLILYKVWDVYVFKKKIQNKLVQSLYNAGAVVITFTFVTFGWIFFNYQTNDIHLIVSNLTTKDSDKIEVSTVVYNNSKYFQIDFKGNDAPYVDIQLQKSNGDSTINFKSIKANSQNIYLIDPEGVTKTLYKVQIRSSYSDKKGKWHSTLSYLDPRDANQSYLEKALFGKPDRATILEDFPSRLVQQPLNLSDDYLNQQIGSEVIYIDNYGWAIQVNYKPHKSYNLSIEYKFEDKNWVSYFENRDGTFDYAHIHGNKVYNGTNYNLLPGEYQLRLAYRDSLKKGDWFYDEISVQDYVQIDTTTENGDN